MSMWCDFPVSVDVESKTVVSRCGARLWPSEFSGKTYKGETRPFVKRHENGTLITVRCVCHANVPAPKWTRLKYRSYT